MTYNKFIVRIVLLSLTILGTQFAKADGVQMVMEDSRASLCKQQISDYNSLKRDLNSKCAGSSKQSCIEQASKCNEDGEESTGASGWGGTLSSILGGSLMPSLGGGMGYPMLGGAGGKGMTCLPKSSREQMKRDLDKLREEANKNEEKALEYKEKIQDKADDLTKEIADLKGKFNVAIKNAKVSQIEVDAQITAARQNAENEAVSILDAIEKREKDKIVIMGDKEQYQNQLQNLYTTEVGGCTDDSNLQKNEASELYYKKRQEIQSQIDAVQDLTQKEAIRRRAEKEILQSESRFKEGLKARYNVCLKKATVSYQSKFKALSSKILQFEKDITSLNNKNDIDNKRLKDIPKVLSQAIEGLKGKKDADSTEAYAELSTIDQQIKQSTSNYQAQYVQAQQRYAEAQQKLNLVQMQNQSSQAMFQMNSFGDAAPIVGDLKEAQSMVCAICAKATDGELLSRAICPPGGSSDGDEGNQ